MQRSILNLIALAILVVPWQALYAWQDMTAVNSQIFRRAQDTVSPELREARGQYFEKLIGPQLPLLETTYPGAPPLVTHVDRPSTPELPTHSADTIVTGYITAVQSYMSPRRDAIYSEYTVKVAAVLKARGTSGRPVITIAELGGAGEMPSGRVLRHQTNGMGKELALNEKYMLFLNYFPKGDFYRVVKAWALKNGSAIANADDDVHRVGSGNSEVNGRPEAEIVARVQELVRKEE